MTSLQPTAPLFELTIEVYDHETWHNYGLFTTRELAEQARDFVLANWGDPEARPSLGSTHIREVPVLDAMPRYQRFYAWAKLEGGDVSVERLRFPQVCEVTPAWHLLEDKARFARVAVEFVAASGHTEEEARERCEAVRAEGLKRGALDFYRKSRELLAQAEVLAREQAVARGVDMHTFAFSTLQNELFDKLVEAKYGPPKSEA